MDDDDVDVDDLWGPPLVVREDTFRKPLRGCEFWFDFRTDVLEESFQIERCCELVWLILNEKKQVAVIDELDKDVGSSDSDKTHSGILPDADTCSEKSSLDEDENTSSISVDLTIETKDSTNDTETTLEPQETAAYDLITVQVAEDGDTSCSPVLASKIEEAEEHSCSSLVTHQAPENKSPSAISQENNESSTLTPVVETREKANATNEEGTDQQQKQSDDSLKDIETASQPFTTESLLEMCDDEPEQDREEAPSDEISNRSMPEALKTVVKEELVINMYTEARIKVESNPPGSVMAKKRKRTFNSINNRGMNTSLIRISKQKVGGETPTKITKGPSVPPQLSDSTLDLLNRIRQRGGKTMGEPVILTSELNDKTGKELRIIAKELKVTHYYKMKKEDLLQHCIMQLTDCKEQRKES